MIIKPIGYLASEIVADKNTGRVEAGNNGSAAQKLGERATLTTDTVAVKSLVAKAMQQPDLRQAKVDGIKASVRDGRYSIDGAQTASAILADQT